MNTVSVELRCARPVRNSDGDRRLCGDPAPYLVDGTSLCPEHAKLVQHQPLMRDEL